MATKASGLGQEAPSVIVTGNGKERTDNNSKEKGNGRTIQERPE